MMYIVFVRRLLGATNLHQDLTLLMGQQWNESDDANVIAGFLELLPKQSQSPVNV